VKKGDVCADKEPEDDRKRKLISLLEEVEVLEKLDSEMRIAAVRCHYSMNKSVIHFNKEKGRKDQ
jgi:hypothetical protein